MKDFQYITSSHPSYIENLYNDFVKDPNSVDTDLRKFFEGFDFAVSSNIAAPAKNGSLITPAAVSTSNLDKEFSVYRLISAYRKKAILLPIQTPSGSAKTGMPTLAWNFLDYLIQIYIQNLKQVSLLA